MEENNDLSNLNSGVSEVTPTQTVSPQQTSNVPIQPSPASAAPQTGYKWLLFGLTGLVAASLGLAGYFGYQNFQLNKEQSIMVQPTPIPTVSDPSPTIDLTSDWKNYNNDFYKFSFKYPSLWSEIPPTGEAYPEGYILIGGKIKEDLLHLSVIPHVGSVENLAAKYRQNPSLFSSTNWGELGKETEQKSIGNLDTVWYENDTTALANGKEIAIQVTNILFTNENLGFLIHTQDNDKNRLNQILSTFKFSAPTNSLAP